MPKFMDTWCCNERESLSRQVPVALGRHCENMVARTSRTMNDKERKELFVEEGEISFSRVYAKSGYGRI
jgi:hypothetical protein